MASCRAGCGWVRRMTAVCGSGVSTVSTAPNMVLNGWFAFTVSTEKATSSEVTGLPSWKRALPRRLRVMDSPSSDTLQLSAR